jgi:integrase
MGNRLSDSGVKRLPTPASGNKIYYDSEETGFGARVTAAGARAFILNYRTRVGRERRFTIGAFPAWTTGAARAEAKALKRRIDRGEDPLAEVQAGRSAPTVADLCARYIEQHLPKKRERSGRDDRAMITKRILPALGAIKVADVTFADIDGLHRKITRGGTPIRANRVVALLSKMFSLAIKLQMRGDNPCRGIERNQENKRTRYLSADEISRLTAALAAHEDQQAANVIRLLLLTGARLNEVQSATWEQFDIERGIWTKPGSTTKQKTEHRIPLSAPARQLLAELQTTAVGDVDVDFVFPGRIGGHRKTIRKVWEDLCESTGLSGVRVHDLRHTFASQLASGGSSLPIIGALLGHTQPSTTARYAHLMDDPLRAAAERVGAVIAGKQDAEVHIINKGRINKGRA